jgi:hypothetical protein
MGEKNNIISLLANAFAELFVGLAAVPGRVLGKNKKNGNGNSDIGSFAHRVQIERLLYTYGYAVDAKDHDTGKALYLSIFSEDAEYSIPGSSSLVGTGDNPPGPSGPGGIGWFYTNFVFPGQIQSLILISNIDIKIEGNRASGQDAFYRTGYKEWDCGEGYYWLPGNYDLDPPEIDPEKLEISSGRHYWECERIKGEWKVTKFQGEMINSSAILGPPDCIEVPEPPIDQAPKE